VFANRGYFPISPSPGTLDADLLAHEKWKWPENGYVMFHLFLLGTPITSTVLQSFLLDRPGVELLCPNTILHFLKKRVL
jgi:hypothetical protein